MVRRRRDGGRCPLGEATGVTVALNVRGEPEEEAVVRQGDAGHVPVRRIIQLIYVQCPLSTSSIFRLQSHDNKEFDLT